MNDQPRIVVVNQSHSVVFQEMVEEMSADIGKIHFLSGRRFQSNSTELAVEFLPAYNRGSLRKRAFSWVHFVLVAFTKLFFSREQTFLFAVSNPPFSANLAWLLWRLRGRPYGILIWDIYPDAVFRHNFISDRSFLARIWKWSNVQSMLHAKFVVTIGDTMKDVLKVQLGDDAQRVRVEVIPNWIDTETIRPIDHNDNSFRAEHGLKNKTVVLYSGNIGAGHGVDILPAAAEGLIEKPNLAFVVIGSGLGSETLRKEINRRDINNLILLPYQPAEVFPLSSASADIAVVFQRPGTEDISMPSKTYTALASGSAILAVTSPNSDLANLVRDEDVGVVVDYSAGSIVEGLNELLECRMRLEEMRFNARRVAVTKFDTKIIKEKWLQVLRDNIDCTNIGSDERSE